MARAIWTSLFLMPMLTACATGPAPRSDVGNAYPNALSGLGTEPFWHLDLSGQRARFSTAEAPSGWDLTVTRREEAARLEVTGELNGQSFRAVVRVGNCSDGMSDRSYPYTLEVHALGQVLQGCAYPAHPKAK